jgi:hypothetical protein
MQVVTSISEERADSILREEMSRSGMQVNLCRNGGRIRLRKWPVRAQDRGKEIEPWLGLWEVVNRKGTFQGHCKAKDRSTGYMCLVLQEYLSFLQGVC